MQCERTLLPCLVLFLVPFLSSCGSWDFAVQGGGRLFRHRGCSGNSAGDGGFGSRSRPGIRFKPEIKGFITCSIKILLGSFWRSRRWRQAKRRPSANMAEKEIWTSPSVSSMTSFDTPSSSTEHELIVFCSNFCTMAVASKVSDGLHAWAVCSKGVDESQSRTRFVKQVNSVIINQVFVPIVSNFRSLHANPWLKSHRIQKLHFPEKYFLRTFARMFQKTRFQTRRTLRQNLGLFSNVCVLTIINSSCTYREAGSTRTR